VQDEHRRIRRDSVDFIERRTAPLGELEFVPSAHHANPLRRRRARDLLAQHVERIGERRHAVPAQLHVEVKTAANDVQVRVVETRNDRAAFKVDVARGVVHVTHHGVARARGDNAAVGDGKRIRERTLVVLRGDLAVEEDDLGRGESG